MGTIEKRVALFFFLFLWIFTVLFPLFRGYRTLQKRFLIEFYTESTDRELGAGYLLTIFRIRFSVRLNSQKATSGSLGTCLDVSSSLCGRKQFEPEIISKRQSYQRFSSETSTFGGGYFWGQGSSFEGHGS